MKPLLLAALLLLAIPAAAQTPLASPGHPGWTRTTEGCFVWNALPQAGETASWSGGCISGRANGRGVEIWRSPDRTSRYEGEMRDGKANGRGVATYANGARYDGEWRDDKLNGRGVLTHADGSRYDGEWRDNNKHGRGILTWSDGRVFDGEWREDKPNGLGRFTNAYGTTYNGIWTNGCFRDGDRRVAVGVDLATCQ